MEHNKKKIVMIGVRIGATFMLAVLVIVFVAYYVLSQSLHDRLSNYSIQLIQSMVDQSVQTVETELEISRNEISYLASTFHAPKDEHSVVFPSSKTENHLLRTLYVTEDEILSSDGRKRDIRDREDIRAAFNGETSVYGPYFNEEKEYVICYSAPYIQDGQVIGVLCMEKDGYRFSNLIENIRFFDTGECYIINAEGTDIAVSDPNHMSWVIEEYNSKELYEKNGDAVTKSILDLEVKALAGERGYGTYVWEGGSVYVIYAPISSEGWAVFAGMREEEISSITKSTIFSSLSGGPALTVSLVVFVLLIGLIIFWIISSFKKNVEINKKLEIIANHDALTGLLNRRYMESSLTENWKTPIKVPSEAAVFMADIDDFKRYNDTFGHQSGDDCLRLLATELKGALASYNSHVIRYGGEEFMTVVFHIDIQTAVEIAEKMCRLVEATAIPNGFGEHVTISIGVCYIGSTLDASLYECIKGADKALYQAKKDGKNQCVVADFSTLCEQSED